MSVDTTFSPRGPTVLIAVTGAQAVNAAGNNQAGITSFRIHNNAAAKQVIGWGTTAASAAAAAVAAAAGAPQWSITMEIGAVIYLELPYNIFFCGNTASTFEVTPGTGGVGG